MNAKIFALLAAGALSTTVVHEAQADAVESSNIVG